MIQLTIRQVQVMAWCRIGNKQLPEPMVTYFTEACKPHLSSIDYWLNIFIFAISDNVQTCKIGQTIK